MKSLTEHLWFEVPAQRGFLNLAAAVEALVRKGGVQEGLCLVNAMHLLKLLSPKPPVGRFRDELAELIDQVIDLHHIKAADA